MDIRELLPGLQTLDGNAMLFFEIACCSSVNYCSCSSWIFLAFKHYLTDRTVLLVKSAKSEMSTNTDGGNK